MRNTRKIFVALVLVLAMMMSVATLFASAADQPETLYLTPNANWKADNARFAAYFFGNGETWVSMTDSNGDGVYEVKVPTDKVYPNVIFCRMNPSASANSWSNKWNQTADLVIPTSGANHYTVKEGTWDSGGGTWSTFGSTCSHTNLSAEATCTAPQTCLDCGDPVVSALGHTYNSSHLCTRCNEQATFTVAGTGAHLGTEWDTGNTANDMTYDAATGTYIKVYEKVAAGSYKFKVARDHDWGTAYPSADKLYTVADAGSTVTITLKGTTVNVTVELPSVECSHKWSDATCDKPQICSECGQSQGEALGHQFDDTYTCAVCGFAPVYTVAGDNAALFGSEWDPTDTDNKMTYDKESGLWTISYVNSGDETIWPNLKVCLNLGWDKAWGGPAAGQTDDNAWVEVPAGKMLTIAFNSTTEKITFTISDAPDTPDEPEHTHNFVDGKCECGETDPTYVPEHTHNFVDGKCECGETDPGYTPDEPETLEYYLVGYINGADYGFADDYATMGDYKFVDGKLTVTFEAADNYVFVKASDNEHWYMASAYCQDTTVTLANTETGAAEKLYVPGGVELTFTLVVNEDDTLTLSYTTSGDPVDPDPTPDTDKVYIIAGDVMMVDGVHVDGINFLVSAWDVTDEANMLVYDEELGCYVKVYENVYAGEYHFKVAVNKSWDVSYGDNGGADNCYVKVDEDGSTLTITFKDGVPTAIVTSPEAPEHTHNFVNGKCECGETDPTYVPENPDPEQPENPDPEQPAPELSLFQKIMKAVTDFFANIANWFKNLFAGFKK